MYYQVRASGGRNTSHQQNNGNPHLGRSIERQRVRTLYRDMTLAHVLHVPQLHPIPAVPVSSATLEWVGYRIDTLTLSGGKE